MREIARVLRPGGVVTLTVPFAASGLRDEYVAGAVYERQASGAATFYQRHYDDAALQKRLIEPSGLRLVDTTYFGEPRAFGSSNTGIEFPCAGSYPCSGRSPSWPSCS